MLNKCPKYLLPAVSLVFAISTLSCKQRTPESKFTENNFKLDRPSGSIVMALTAGKEQKLLVVVRHDSKTVDHSNFLQSYSTDSAIDARVAKFRSLKQLVLDAARSKKISIDDTYSHLPILRVSAKSMLSCSGFSWRSV